MKKMTCFAEIDYTSDHIMQYINIELNDIQLSGYTWNLQKKCVKGNNPFKINEDNTTYIKRKYLQFHELLQCDFAFIQEADFFNIGSLLYDDFHTMLAESSYSYVVAAKQGLIILFNHLVLEYLPNTQKEDCRGRLLLAGFKHIETGKHILLGSFHLSFNGDYNDVFTFLSTKYLNEYDLFVTGGDSNNISTTNKEGIRGMLISSPFRATNFNIDPYGRAFIYHEKNRSKVKCYDGFIIHKKCSSMININITAEAYWSITPDKRIVLNRKTIEKNYVI